MRPFWKGVIALVAAGTPGIVALLLALPTARAQVERLGQAPPSDLVLSAAIMVQPFVLLVAACIIGMAAAPKVGLRSHLADLAGCGRSAVALTWRDLLVGMAAGAVAAVIAAVLDETVLSGRTAATTIVGVLYGGATEEILIRWGLMSAVAWGLAKATGRSGVPKDGAMWLAIVIAALMFGAGHLPAAALMTGPLSSSDIVRVVGLNAVVGVFFGWLFWRSGLESAMAGHATLHVVWSIGGAVLGR